ncbi:hypothetical protein CYY_001919 [Polysphondylium violaceum]|uniref:Metallo-beta-lactamase domain-containing protein n=1 Tax=Polysphondylium violaceum TaxID=133409 RepID=A0A8J4PZ10_9MYCE|nr:hypothetical protein CYY_001919 [Polysphondylium violaceum]
MSTFHLIRNATIFLTYNNVKFLIDPFLAEKDRYPGFAGTVNSEVRNPTVELPCKAETLFGYDYLLLTHTHPDHWDEVAAQVLPKDKPIFCQNEYDANLVKKSGFTNVSVLKEVNQIGGVTIHTTPCQHGSDQVYAIPPLAEFLGQVTGFVFEHPNEKKLYIVGDSVFIDGIGEALKKHQPDYVAINSGNAQLTEGGAIIMSEKDIPTILSIVPKAKIIAIHMESLNHCITTRKDVENFCNQNNIKNVIIPKDNETFNL